ncbi:MAG: tetratricopeptide repeat protein [Pirellulales bacterium]|nr:tetratricopeptide repeat protein [Pirellulales bacterium]
MDKKMQFEGDFHFQRLCAGASEVDLIGLMSEFARDAAPNHDISELRTEINRLRFEFRQLLRPVLEELFVPWVDQQNDIQATDVCHTAAFGGADAHLLLMAALAIFRQTLGFEGDTDDYYCPDNSYLHRVIERRKGIPISLAILFQELASGCGIILHGVSTPGHFVLAYSAGEPLYVDAFSAEILSQSELEAKLERQTGESVWDERVFRPASHLTIAARVLRNLKEAYARLDQWDAALLVQRRLVALLPEFSDEQRDLGLLLVRTGNPWPALEILEPYVQQQPQEAESLEPFLRTARRMSVQWN